VSRAVTRIGLVGFGFIGSQVYDRIAGDPDLGLEIAFVHARDPSRLSRVPPGLVLGDLAQAPARRADLVVEVAHPDYTRHWGERLLAHADYLAASVTALADDALLARLRAACTASGRRLFVPHGALIGTDNLLEWRHMWREVEIAFVKNPAHIDFSESGIDPAGIVAETVVYDGPVRGIAARFPRNVNTMVTCALATVGLDRCRARLVAVPGAATASIDIVATGADGASLRLHKTQPMAGVSGTEMVASTVASILRASGRGEGLQFV
jgi:aspartate dehydrogenase